MDKNKHIANVANMKVFQFVLTILIPIILFLSPAAYSVSTDDDKVQRYYKLVPVDESDKLNNDERLNVLEERLKEVRRDQLNYKIEKDLLKEAYSSSINTVNIILAIVLAGVSILGLMGFKGINVIRAEFKRELEDMRQQRKSYDEKLQDLEEVQRSVKKVLSELESKTQQTDLRLRVMEVQERVNQLIKDDRYRAALKFANEGLKIDPDDIPLLYGKQLCHSKLGEFTEAIETGDIITQLDPNSKNPLTNSAITNSAEAYLLSFDYDAYDKYYEENKAVIDNREFLVDILTILKTALTKSKKEIRDKMVELVSKYDKDKKIDSNWSFNESLPVIMEKRDKEIVKMVHSYSKLMKGEISIEEFFKEIGHINQE